jgi:hypothetical protein
MPGAADQRESVCAGAARGQGCGYERPYPDQLVDAVDLYVDVQEALNRLAAGADPVRVRVAMHAQLEQLQTVVRGHIGQPGNHGTARAVTDHSGANDVRTVIGVHRRDRRHRPPGPPYPRLCRRLDDITEAIVEHGEPGAEPPTRRCARVGVTSTKVPDGRTLRRRVDLPALNRRTTTLTHSNSSMGSSIASRKAAALMRARGSRRPGEDSTCDAWPKSIADR